MFLMVSDITASMGAVWGIVIGAVVIGITAAFVFSKQVAKIDIMDANFDVEKDVLNENRNLLDGDDDVKDHDEHEEDDGDEKPNFEIHEIAKLISDGANAFLMAEYIYMATFIVVFSLIILALISLSGDGQDNTASGVFTAIAFICGAVASIISGWIGMRIAVFANSRTTIMAKRGLAPAFTTAFKAGAVMGFGLVSLGIVVLWILINLFKLQWVEAYTAGGAEATKRMYEALAGYGLGGSSIALFGRVGGGIYTKAADVGADLVGKVVQGMDEDDPRNPGVIADNVGDNVGDVAGMGADLFGSFAEATCAAMVVSSQMNEAGSPDQFLGGSPVSMAVPVLISCVGLIACFITSLVAIREDAVTNIDKIEDTLKQQLVISTVLSSIAVVFVCLYFLPSQFRIKNVTAMVTPTKAIICVLAGLWAGLAIGYTTDYYTSHAHGPVREVAASCETGAATNIIYGLALGYKSAIIPTIMLSITIFVGFKLAGMYGIAMAALGILSTLSIGLTIDAYGPICDNAGGIAEMCNLGVKVGPHVREFTDALDAAGNTTAAIGKGFAIGSAALVSLALFGAFSTTVDLKVVDILEPWQFAGLLYGAMLPYWFSAMTMKSVGMAAMDMIKEIKRQADEDRIDYEACIAISTQASLREMIAPGALVMLTPLVFGYLFGVECLAGLLAGALVSGVQMAISSSNTGGAWDNAKKYIESGKLQRTSGDRQGTFVKKKDDEHTAAVIGDTVGDPLKDTSGPSLNILIKLMAIISLVFGPSMNKSGGLISKWVGTTV